MGVDVATAPYVFNGLSVVTVGVRRAGMRVLGIGRVLTDGVIMVRVCVQWLKSGHKNCRLSRC